MGVYFVLLAHGGIAVLLLASWWLPARIKDRIAVGASFLGVAAGAVAFALHNSNETWRSVALDGSTTAVAASAAVCAWLLVGVLDLGPHRYAAAVLTGIVATGLSMFASNEWSVPAMLFWAAGSLAIVVMIVRSESGDRALALAVLLASDALLFASLLWHALDRDVWALPSPASGGPFWLAVTAAVLRVGVVPRVGPWSLLATAAAPVIPLLAGGGAVIAGDVGGRAEPWLAVALLAIATAISIGGVFFRRVSLGVIAAWPAALGLATMFVSGDAVAVGGIAIVVGATVHALWHRRSTVVSVESAAAVSFVPATVGFAAVAVAATAAFFRTDLAESGMDKAPWIAVAALLPVTLAASIACAARIGRSEPVGGHPRRAPTWAVRALLGVSLVVGGAATTTGELGAPSSRELGLFAVAGVAAAAAALIVLRWGREVAHPAVDSVEFDVEPLRPPQRIAFGTTLASIAIGCASLAGLAYLTYEGLRQGFL